MAPVPIEIAPPPAEPMEAPLIVDDLDEIVESSMCSCNAGDDNPY